MKYTINKSAKQNLTLSLLVALVFMMNALNVFSQTKIINDSVFIASETGKKILLTDIGTVKIILNSGTIYKKCHLHEISAYSIVYEREGSLHDLQIQKINKIKIGETNDAVYFDDENKPVIKMFEPTLQINYVSNSMMYNVAYTKDFIVDMNGDTILCSIINKTPTYLYYTEKGKSKRIGFAQVSRFGTMPTGNGSAIDTSEIKSSKNISYQQPVYFEKPEVTNYYASTSRMNYREMGRADAKQYFKGRGAFTGGFISGIFFPVGWFSEILIAATPAIKIDNPKNPNNELLETNAEYRKGYKRQAHIKKAGKAIGGFAMGIISILMLVVVVL